MAAYNRYKGNSGERPVRVESAPPQRCPMPPPPRAAEPSLTQKFRSLSSFLPKELGRLETEDLLLVLILYLMYRESGDRELLIIMGALFL